MKTDKTAGPVRALLKTRDEGRIDRTFVNKLLDDCRDHAANYPRKIAEIATATDSDEPGWIKMRASYLNTFLQCKAPEMSAVLFFQWTDRAASDAERKRAALLYLHGGGLGYWKINADNLRAARELAGIAAPTKENQTMVRTVKKTKPEHDETKWALAIAHACVQLEAACKSTDADDAAKLDAIERWFHEIGWLAPKDLQASLDRLFAPRH